MSLQLRESSTGETRIWLNFVELYWKNADGTYDKPYLGNLYNSDESLLEVNIKYKTIEINRRFCDLAMEAHKIGLDDGVRFILGHEKAHIIFGHNPNFDHVPTKRELDEFLESESNMVFERKANGYALIKAENPVESISSCVALFAAAVTFLKLKSRIVTTEFVEKHGSDWIGAYVPVWTGKCMSISLREDKMDEIKKKAEEKFERLKTLLNKRA